MKLLIVSCLMLVLVLLQGCATIGHKEIYTRWRGYGADVLYISRPTMTPEELVYFMEYVQMLKDFEYAIAE